MNKNDKKEYEYQIKRGKWMSQMNKKEEKRNKKQKMKKEKGIDKGVIKDSNV